MRERVEVAKASALLTRNKIPGICRLFPAAPARSRYNERDDSTQQESSALV